MCSACFSSSLYSSVSMAMGARFSRAMQRTAWAQYCSTLVTTFLTPFSPSWLPISWGSSSGFIAGLLTKKELAGSANSLQWGWGSVAFEDALGLLELGQSAFLM